MEYKVETYVSEPLIYLSSMKADGTYNEREFWLEERAYRFWREHYIDGKKQAQIARENSISQSLVGQIVHKYRRRGGWKHQNYSRSRRQPTNWEHWTVKMLESFHDLHNLPESDTNQ